MPYPHLDHFAFPPPVRRRCVVSSMGTAAAGALPLWSAQQADRATQAIPARPARSTMRLTSRAGVAGAWRAAPWFGDGPCRENPHACHVQRRAAPRSCCHGGPGAPAAVAGLPHHPHRAAGAAHVPGLRGSLRPQAGRLFAADAGGRQPGHQSTPDRRRAACLGAESGHRGGPSGEAAPAAAGAWAPGPSHAASVLDRHRGQLLAQAEAEVLGMEQQLSVVLGPSEAPLLRALDRLDRLDTL